MMVNRELSHSIPEAACPLVLDPVEDQVAEGCRPRSQTDLSASAPLGGSCGDSVVAPSPGTFQRWKERPSPAKIPQTALAGRRLASRAPRGGGALVGSERWRTGPMRGTIEQELRILLSEREQADKQIGSFPEL